MAGQPLWRLLGGADPEVPVYASGLNPQQPEKLAASRFADGFRAFKLKIGFGADRDLANLRALRAALGDDARLMVDDRSEERRGGKERVSRWSTGWSPYT